MAETIFFFDYFYDGAAERLIKEIAVKAKFTKDIRLIINSAGGSVTSLLAIIDAINLMNINLETVCIGQTASCGAWLLSMGKKRYITKNARVLLHQVSGGCHGDIQDMEIGIDEAKRINEKMLDILSVNLKKDKEVLREELTRDKILTPEQAVAYGIADEIIDNMAVDYEVTLFKKTQFEEAVKESVKQLSENKEMKLYSIKDKELFKAGTHKDKTYTEKDIENLVNNTNLLMKDYSYQVPIKLGHDDSKTMLEMLSEDFKKWLKSDSMPAFGSIENIRKVGESAVGDLVNIPEPIFNLIDKQLFCKRSPEIWTKYKIHNKELGLVLDSIALLGATQPEIPDLFTKEKDTIDNEEEKMTKELEAQLAVEQAAKVKAEADKATAETKAKEESDKAAAAEKELAEFKAAAKKEKVEIKVNDLIAKGSIYPYQKKALTAVLEKLEDSEEKITFSKDDKEQELNISNAFEDLFSNRPKIDLTATYSQKEKEEANKNLSEAEKQANEILKASGLSDEEIKAMA